MIEKDTVLVITKSQLIKVNRSLNELKGLRLANDNLQATIRVSDSLVSHWRQTASTMEDLLHFEEQKYEQSVKLNNALTKELKNEQKKSRNIAIGVGVGGVLLGLLLGCCL